MKRCIRYDSTGCDPDIDDALRDATAVRRTSHKAGYSPTNLHAFATQTSASHASLTHRPLTHRPPMHQVPVDKLIRGSFDRQLRSCFVDKINCINMVFCRLLGSSGKRSNFKLAHSPSTGCRFGLPVDGETNRRITGFTETRRRTWCQVTQKSVAHRPPH